MTISEFPGVPADYSDEKQHRRLLARAIQLLMAGRSNNVLDVTLTANDTTTTVTDTRIGANSAALCVPTTANAQAIAMPYRSNAVNGSMILTHANDANADKTFKVVLIG